MADLGSQANLISDVNAKVTTNGANENTGARVNANLKNIVDTLYAALAAAAGAGAGVNYGNCVFVNGSSGDDGTGARERMDLPFETLDAAYAASVAGDVIIGLDDGTYTFNNDVTKDLNLYFPNSKIDTAGGSSSALLLAVDSLNVTIECKQFVGDFIAQDSVATPTVGHYIQLRNTAGLPVVIPGDGSYTALNNCTNPGGFTLGDSSFLIVDGGDTGSVFATGTGAVVQMNRAYNVGISGALTLTATGSTFLNGVDGSVTLGSCYGNIGIQSTLSLQFTPSTADADPGGRSFRLNSATFSSITEGYLSTTSLNGDDITAYLDSLAGGRLVMKNPDGTIAALFDYGAVTTATGYRKIALTPVFGNNIVAEYWTFDFREAGGGGGSSAWGAITGTLSDQTDLQAALDSKPDKVGVFTLFIEVGADKQYTLDAYAAFGYTINSLAIKSGSGTANATVKINGTSVTGITSVGVNSGGALGTAGGANTVSAGQRVVVELDTTVVATDIELTLKYTRS